MQIPTRRRDRLSGSALLSCPKWRIWGRKLKLPLWCGVLLGGRSVRSSSGNPRVRDAWKHSRARNVIRSPFNTPCVPDKALRSAFFSHPPAHLVCNLSCLQIRQMALRSSQHRKQFRRSRSKFFAGGSTRGRADVIGSGEKKNTPLDSAVIFTGNSRE